MSQAEAIAPIGHNQGPPVSDWAEELHPAVIRDQLEVDYADLTSRRDELLAAGQRLFEQHAYIPDDTVNGKAGDFSAKLLKFQQWTEKCRKEEIATWQALERVVQRFFKADHWDPVGELRARVDAATTAFLAGKARRERERLAAEAKRLAEQALEADDQAAMSGRPEDVNDAQEAIERAERAAREAQAPAAALTRSRGAVSTISLTTSYAIEVVDEGEVRRELCSPDPDKLKRLLAGAPRDASGIPQLSEPGLRVVEVLKSKVRA